MVDRKKSESESSWDDCVFIIPVADDDDEEEEEDRNDSEDERRENQVNYKNFESQQQQPASNDLENEELDGDAVSESYFDCTSAHTSKKERDAYRVVVGCLVTLSLVYSIIVVFGICDDGGVSIDIYYNIAVTVLMWIGTGTAAALILISRNSLPSNPTHVCLILWKIVEKMITFSVLIVIIVNFDLVVRLVVGHFVVAIYEILDTILLLCVLFEGFVVRGAQK